MKKFIFGALTLVLAQSAIAQGLPPNPTPGKCYVRCNTPEVWKNEEVRIMATPAYRTISTSPAQFKTVTEKVMTKEPGKRLEIVPAVWETKQVSYVAKQDANSLKAVKAKFGNDSQSYEVKAASAKWQMSAKLDGCDSNDPNDCRYWCYKEVPAEYKTVSFQKLVSDADVSSSPIPGFNKTYSKKVMVTPPTTRVIEIPAEYKEIKKVVLVTDASKNEVSVPATYKTITKQTIVSKGGLTTWKAVDCKLVEGTPLPINWNTGSSTLTSQAKRIIDQRLYPILEKGMSVVIESHTDSRGSDSKNESLSQRRAQSVANYLISKKINPSQLTSKGMGERRLTNRCSNGVSCTEAEHRKNRRTTFRVLK